MCHSSELAPPYPLLWYKGGRYLLFIVMTTSHELPHKSIPGSTSHIQLIAFPFLLSVYSLHGHFLSLCHHHEILPSHPWSSENVVCHVWNKTYVSAIYSPLDP